MSRKIGSPNRPNNCAGPLAGSKHSQILKNSPPPYLLTGITILRLRTAKPANKSKLGASITQRAKIWAGCLLSLHFFDSVTLVTSHSTGQLRWAVKISYQEFTFIIITTLITTITVITLRIIIIAIIFKFSLGK